MARQKTASKVWASNEQHLDRQRYRFLVATDKVAPHIWQELGNKATAEQIEAWAKKHHLGAWVVPYALDRLERVNRGRGRWMRPYRGRRPELKEAFTSPPIYDPSIMSRATYRRKVQIYVERIESAARENGLLHLPRASDRDLVRLVRWQVLGDSPETIARAEVGHSPKAKYGEALRTRAEDVRDVVRKLARHLALPARPRGKPGQRRGGWQATERTPRSPPSGWLGAKVTRTREPKFPTLDDESLQSRVAPSAPASES